MKETIEVFTVLILFILFVFTLIFGSVYLKSSQEAKTFNKFSEQDATTWDAFWADLRVEACRSNQ